MCAFGFRLNQKQRLQDPESISGNTCHSDGFDSTARDRDAEQRPFARLGDHRDPAAVLMDDLAGDKEPDTGPLNRSGRKNSITILNSTSVLMPMPLPSISKTTSVSSS